MSAEALAKQTEEQLKLAEKSARRLDASKHQQSASFQEKLNARLKKKEEKLQSQNEENEKNSLQSAGTLQVEAPLGDVTFALLTIKNMASLWEALTEDSALKALENIHHLVVKDLNTSNVYKAKEEVGKFWLAAQNAEDMVNVCMKIQLNFNSNKWSDLVMKIPGYKKVVRPEDSNNSDAEPLFNGPRVQIGIHRGEATNKKDTSGRTSYSGVNLLKVESICNFAQGGQILMSDTAWKTVDQSKLNDCNMTEPGIYKLDGFSAGCKVVEILPNALKDRSKFFGSVCAHCNDVIKPNEQFFRALNCIWHLNHFRCFECNADLGGSYVEHEGSPYCKNCYLVKNAPKCKNCSQPITSGYINALGGYWHNDCFSCKRCLKKPSPTVQIYEFDGLPYCTDCYKQVAGM